MSDTKTEAPASSYVWEATCVGCRERVRAPAITLVGPQDIRTVEWHFCAKCGGPQRVEDMRVVWEPAP